MDLRLFDVLVAFAGLCLLLLVGTALRQRLRWLKALGISEALIAIWGLPLFSAAALAFTLASLGFGLRLGRAQ